MENDERYSSTSPTAADVPDNWEETTAESSSSKALEARIVEQAKLKQKQQQQIDVNQQGSEMECRTFSPIDAQANSQGPPQTPQIRILKRPESSDELNKQPQQQLPQQTAADVLSSYNSAPSLPSNRKGSGRTHQAMNAIGTKTLEERVTAYAQARERIFGVVDPTVHDDLPLQPKLLPRSKDSITQQPPSTTAESSSS